jgi:hypothetical protein
LYLDENSPRYISGILKMLNARLFRYWNDLPEGLRTGQPQNETKHGEKGVFEMLYEEPAKLEGFLNAMSGLSRPNFEALASAIDFSKFKTLCDIVSKSRATTLISSVSAGICRPSSRSRAAASPPRGSPAECGPSAGIFSRSPCPKRT